MTTVHTVSFYINFTKPGTLSYHCRFIQRNLCKESYVAVQKNGSIKYRKWISFQSAE